MKFEEFKLSSGYPLQLQTNNNNGQAERFSSRLIGCIPGRSILLSAPIMAKKIARFRPGQKIVVRMMVDNGIGVFVCVAESQVNDPYPILYVSYPDQVSFKGIRGATRVTVNLPVCTTNISAVDQPSTGGTIADISTSGARIGLDEAIVEIGDKIELKASLNIENITRELTISAIIRSRLERSTQEENQNLPATYGIEFADDDEDKYLLIYAYVFREMARGNRQRA
jgi:hypothetical protein